MQPTTMLPLHVFHSGPATLAKPGRGIPFLGDRPLMECQGSCVHKGTVTVSHPAASAHQHSAPTPGSSLDLDYSPLSSSRLWRETLDPDKTKPRAWPSSSPLWPQGLICHRRVALIWPCH